MNSTDYNKYLVSACEIAREAGHIIMVYFSDGYTSNKKSDNSPVTEADIAANKYIIEKLTAIAPHIPIIAEEDEILGSSEHKRFFLVDPLDGTRSFVRGEPEFTVNIALIENNLPVFGVIYCPPQDILYFGMVGDNAYKQIGGNTPEIIKTRKFPDDGLTVVRSRSHPSKATNAYLETLNIKEVISGSSSVKFCMVAEGSADIYPRFGRTMEWDTAAGHAILNAAGGRVETADGKPFLYGKEGFENPAFIGFGRNNSNK
ncbi:MAG: 3'(2'),5'-bisphosphate nucleotidase CysQ [Rickettsiales bacterium]